MRNYTEIQDPIQHKKEDYIITSSIISSPSPHYQDTFFIATNKSLEKSDFKSA
jgi:hypothetical protein